MPTVPATRLGDGLAAVARDSAAGLAAAAITISYCFSFGALIFSGPLSDWVGVGIGAALLTAAVTGLIVALGSEVRIACAGPGGTTAALQAAMIAGIFPILQALPNTELRPATALVALMGTAAFTGIVLFVLGWRRAGRLVRFVPFPVTAGFLAATGWLMVRGAVGMLGPVSFTADGLAALAGPTGVMIGLAAGWAVVLLVMQRLIRHPLALPCALIAGVIATHAAMPLFGLDVMAAWDMGLLFPPGESGGAWALTHMSVLAAVDPGVLLAVAGDALAIALVAALAILMSATGLELALGRDADLDRQLRVEGTAIMASAAAGGFVGHLSISRAIMVWRAGAQGRAAGITSALAAAVMLAVGGDLVALIPRFLLAGLLLMVGLEMLWQWLYGGLRRLPWRDGLTVVAILLLTATIGLPAALIFGILAGCVIFVVDVSRVGVIRRVLGLHEHPSCVERTPEHMSLIARHGSTVRILQLRGFIFFGSAHRLYEQVKQMTAAGGVERIVFDFTAVTGMDSSAGAAFSKVAQLLRDQDVAWGFSGLRPQVSQVLAAAGVLTPETNQDATLDAALERAEEALIARYGDAHAAGRDFTGWLAGVLDDPAAADRLLACLERVELPEDAWLSHTGDASDSMVFVEHGRVGVLLEPKGQAPMRVRSLDRHTVLGEMGFLLGQPRGAGLRAETPVVLWRLTRPAFDRLQAEAPAVVAALYRFLFALQSDRLAFANRQVAALQRD